MAKFLYKTKGNSSYERKPRVYFTCHPNDFSIHFEKICDDIFKTHDCAIYYTESMTEEIEEQYLESDIGQMHLFVIPVTFKLLSEPSRAMDFDLQYARSKKIPILPIMVENDLYDIYSHPDKFGETQCLTTCARDATAIRYGEKLKKYLDSVLISNETAERIRKAFDAYIFLSYRKKDRHYANELMKIIHSYPQYRDIAIWYDEFLTPGESFRENILHIMKNSKLFALLVTPNLLEYVNGEPNYVMKHEYPEAKTAGMDILPTEMAPTDKKALKSKYKDIPECVNPADEEIFEKRLAESLSRIAISENNDDPNHNFLIGLAYLEGIDVERNVKRGIELIESAAEAKDAEAMQQLYHMYLTGDQVNIDYPKSIYWCEQFLNAITEEYGENSPEKFTALSNLIAVYDHAGLFSQAAELAENHLHLYYEILGEEAEETANVLYILSTVLKSAGRFSSALNYSEKAYELNCKIWGPTHEQSILCLNNLALTYTEFGRPKKAISILRKAYDILKAELGDEHSHTLYIQNNIAAALNELALTKNEPSYHLQALEIHKKTLELRIKVNGERAPSTLTSMSDLALTYGHLKDFDKALEGHLRTYELMRQVLGEEHPETLTSLGNIGYTYGLMEDHKTALQYKKKSYQLRKKISGPDHPLTMLAMNNLANTYIHLNKPQEALPLFEQAALTRGRVLGNKHHDTLESLIGWAIAAEMIYEKAPTFFNLKRAISIYEQVAVKYSEAYGDDDCKCIAIYEKIICLKAMLSKKNKA